MTDKAPIHQLPLPRRTLQSSLPRLKLDDKPSAQRRSTTFAASTPGIWARVYPMWTAWPLRITKSEVEEMGVNVDAGEQVDVEDVLRRWDVEDSSWQSSGESSRNGLQLRTSKHRAKLEGHLIGVSPMALRDSLPHLDVGDASEVCNDGAEPMDESTAEGSCRKALADVISGRQVLVSRKGKEPAQDEDEDKGPPSSDYGPWSTRYCGHQFGQWAGQLGDGRAISLFETESEHGGRQEVQLKGGGRTPFSRQADGLAVMRSGVREYLGCEAIAALGIPTTRSLALMTTPDLPVIREYGPEPPSLLARLAPTFIRLGHFEALKPGPAAHNLRHIFLGGGWQDESEEGDGPLDGQGNLESLRDLTEWCKYIMGFEGKSTVDWVGDVIKRNAEMVAQWQVYGFMHGVLNSDNISIMGLTIDYGPYAFMDIWDEGHICNHSDPTGLYSYKRQPERVLFDLDKFVSAISPLIGYEKEHGQAQAGWSEGKTKEDVKDWTEAAEEVMSSWKENYRTTVKDTERQGWLKRFGLRTYQPSDDRDIIADFLVLLHAHSLDFHTSFRHLCSFLVSQNSNEAYVKSFLTRWLELSGPTLPQDSTESAQKALRPWLDVYTTRVLADAEVQAWSQNHENDPNTPETNASWQQLREKAMKKVNPRFVLRQWVLEEVISDIEKAGLEDLVSARKSLARVLDLATNPFEEWDDTCSEEGVKRAELCGVGKKEMLGFQCSCSS
ncbi:hypothetical protein BD324DRAFT_652165 [Kockovaella imperatae]|uniref:Selenoprotein O n=1 Tax=Kockovaella imperatae TaxID=4999 RepID=A0A1Y1UEX0_9TREE|nr:hypothetical protein BD324DRAFT_652165 [Kockovaella imperatae]ORX35615.1 hypothetical protein BD324DRAFT_652165 [Kockovaella imperatae]